MQPAAQCTLTIRKCDGAAGGLALPAACVTGSDVFATVTDVDRAEFVLDAAVAVNVPVPVCPPPLAMSSHDTGDFAVHAQFDPVVTVIVMD